ncbi:MAG: hypothetical protein AAGH70_06235 [Pseudomonadota bacterium]
MTLPSPAERTVMTAGAGIAACGCLLAGEALKGLQGFEYFVGPTAGGWISALCAAAGAIIGTLLMRQRFGGRGLQGGLNAVLAGLLATFLMGIVAGTLVLPIFGTMFGPWLILTTVLAKPWLSLPWLLSLYALNLAMKEYRDERDSVFNFVPEFDAT